MMLGVSVGLLLMGVFLSAFFSGSETGFYRASRVRIVLAGLDGDRVSKYLIKLINNPALFVATTLIGNNVANYITSLAIVLIASQLTSSDAAELAAPLLLAPVLFVYGELLPKNLFFQAPNMLLRRAGPLLLVFTGLFAPVAALLWGVGRLMEKLLGHSPERVRLTLARRELQQVWDDGQEAGILHPTQRYLGQSFFLVASKPVREICTPVSRVHSIAANSSRSDAKQFAKQKRLADIPVFDGDRNHLVGYIRTVDLLVNADIDSLDQVIRSLTKVEETEVFGEAILQMQSSKETLARVVDSNQTTIGLLSIDQLTDPLLKGPLGTLKR